MSSLTLALESLRSKIIACLFFPLLTFGQISIGDSQGSTYAVDSINICGDSNGEIFSIVGGVGHYSHTKWSSSNSSVSLQVNYNNDSTKVLTSWNLSALPLSFTLYLKDTIHGFNDSLHVSVNSPPNVTLNNHWSSVSMCAGTNTSVSGGSPPGGTYSIIGNPGVISNDTVLDVTSLGTGNYNLMYSYTDSLGCTNSDTNSISVNINSLPNVTLNNHWTSIVACAFSDTTVSGGLPAGGTYSIVGYPGVISNDTVLDLTSLGAGNHNLVYSYTDSLGCTNSDTNQLSIGLSLSGGTTNIIVSEVYGATSSVLFPVNFSSGITYPACSGLSSTTFGISFTNNSAPLIGSSLVIDWGDGYSDSSVVSVGYSYNHYYAYSGSYPVIMTIIDSAGCSFSSSFNLYFGSTQILGLSTPGNTSLCFAPYEDSVSFDFEVLNWEEDATGTQYRFGCNDSSKIKTVSAPLVVNGVPVKPWLIFDPSDSTLSYRHWFQNSSCGYNTVLGGQSYDNVFAITATKQSPCVGSQSTAAVGPIVVSQSPETGLFGDTIACVDQYITIRDSIRDGNTIVPTSNGNFVCDTAYSRVWLVYDEFGNPLSPGSSTFTVGSGTSLGDTNVSLYLPSLWTSGSYRLSLAFHQRGRFRIKKLHGLTANGSQSCVPDTASIWVCVDTLSGMRIVQYIPDTVCLGSEYEVIFQHESSLCFDSLTYQITISTPDGNIVDSSSTDNQVSKFVTINTTGQYIIEYTSPNPCGENIIMDTFYVEDVPDYQFNADSEICSDTLILTVGQETLDFGTVDIHRPIDSTYYNITPSTGWRFLGLDAAGFEIFAFDSTGLFEVYYEFHNSCGYSADTIRITNYELPNSEFSLTESPDCGVLHYNAAVIDSASNNSHYWSLYADSGATHVWTDSLFTQFNDSIASTQTYGYAWYMLQHIAVTPFGCRDTTQKYMYVLPTPQVDFGIDQSGCDPWVPLISNISQGDGLAFTWSTTALGNSSSLDSVDGLLDTVPYLLFNPIVFPDNDESYEIKLVGLGPDGCEYVQRDTVIIRSQPLADIVIPDTICASEWYPLYDSSKSHHNILSFTWSSPDNALIFDDVNTQNTNVYVLPVDSLLRAIDVTLVIQNEFSCLDTVVKTLYVLPAPVLDLDIDEYGCDSVYLMDVGVNLTDPVNFGDSVSFTWAITNSASGVTDTFNDFLPNYLFTNDTNYAIPYYIWLNGINSPGCFDIAMDTILIYPDVELDLNTASGLCSPVNIDTALLQIDVNQSASSHWVWITDTSGDTLYSSSTLNYQLVNAGDTVFVTYEVFSDWGCSSDKETVMIFSVDDGDPISYPTAIFDNSQNCYPDTVCLGDAVTFYSTSIEPTNGAGISQINWDLGNDGIINQTGDSATFTLNQSGWVSIWMQAQTISGCNDDTLKQIYVMPGPTVSVKFDDDSLCAPISPTFTHSQVGFYDSVRFELYLLTDSGTTNLIQSWSTIPILPILQPSYSTHTRYILKKILLSCCEDISAADTILIKTPPVANFFPLPNSGCTDLDVSLILNGQITGEADSAFIDWGDGYSTPWTRQLVPGPNGLEYSWMQPTHNFIYGGAGDTTYTITLTVYNECGDSSITKDVILTSGAISAAFTASDLSGCEPLTVDFTSLAYNYDILGWCFNYDPVTKTCDTSVSVSPNPQHTYDTNGTYYVAHFASNECGIDTVIQTIDVYPNVAADFNSTNFLCGNDTVSFVNTSYSNNGVISGYKWMFGDGDSSFSISPKHVYDTGAVYTVTLYTYSNNGCVSTKTKEITIYPTPDISISGAPVCLGDTSSFSSIINIQGGGNIAGILWDFGDGNGSVSQNPSHLYQYDSTFTVSLLVTSDNGCTDYAATNVLVNPSPVSAFTPVMIQGDSCSVPQTFSFINSTQNGASYEWDFDASAFPGIYTSTLNSPTFTYNSARNYTIKLKSETAFGCVDSTTRLIQINSSLTLPPTISQKGCLPLSIGYLDSSAASNGVDSIIRVDWSMGDGTTITNYSPPFGYNHVYNLPGTYSVYATITTVLGCVSQTAPAIMYVTQDPTAQFSNDTNGVNGMNFENLSIPLDSTYSYYWTFSDGQESFDISPTMIFNPSATAIDSLEICLYVTTPDNCTDSICKRIWVWKSSLFVPNALAPEQVFSNDDQYFLPKGFGLASYELWIYDKWGNEVFYSNELADPLYGPAVGWDGNDQRTGEPAPMGVYAWKIRATFRDGSIWNGQENVHGFERTYGTLTLIR